MATVDLQRAWTIHIDSTPAGLEWFDIVMTHYAEPGRHYHVARHIQATVGHVLDLGEGRLGLSTIVAAAFFHDVVYDATRGDNEARSAAFGTRVLAELKWDEGDRERVGEMVLATARHDTSDADLDTAVLLAADLSILRAEHSVYRSYVSQVRQEYGHLGEDEWTDGRASVLQMFLDRGAIFDVRLGLDDWEAHARLNISAELADLRRESGE